MRFKNTLEFAHIMDNNDALAAYRERFYIPKQPNGKDVAYLCGHSLGLQPKTVRGYVEQELLDWQNLGVRGHFEAHNPWLYYHELLTEPTARLVGANPLEVVVMNSVTVNLHAMLTSFFRPTFDRDQIVIEPFAFPSDRYALQSQLRLKGFSADTHLQELPLPEGKYQVSTEDILAFLEAEGETIALLLMGGVNYFTGQSYDMRAITRTAHAKGCLVGWDLSHAVGNIVLKLHDWDVDFAVWCNYKYLNAGPGHLGGCFIHERFADEDLPRLAGWWGHNSKNRFLMANEFEPILGAEGWQISNPPILPLAALRASMAIFEELSMDQLRAKSKLLTGYLEFLLHSLGHEHFQLITPTDPSQRGAQLSLKALKADKSLYEKLLAAGVIVDWREPDVIRMAPVPLYNSFLDIYRCYDALRQALAA